MVDLYTAAILDSGVPAKKTRSKKGQEPAEPKIEEEEPKIEEPAKKVRSEKQIAAAARMVEARRLKRESQEAERAAAEKAENEAREAAELILKAKEAKKAEQREKRRLKREANKPQLAEMTATEPSETAEPPAKKARNEEEPPAWLETLIKGIKTEESMQARDRKPKRQIKLEAEEHAHKAWQEPVTRARVQQHQDQSLAKMYSMIFSNRNF